VSIEQQLAERHANDLFVAECNTGSAWAGCRRMDGWALKRTYTPPTTIGYEVKRTRGDFMRDDKWPEYLPYCNHFYFVAPKGVIEKAEVPEGCGLVIAGKRLIARVKAPRREVDPKDLVKIMTYVLMSRAVVTAAGQNQRPEDEDFWRDWLERKDERDTLGRSVSKELQRRVRAAELASEDAVRERRAVDKLVAELERRGLSISKGRNDWAARSAVKRLIDRETGSGQIETLRRAHQQLGQAIETIDAVRREAIETRGPR
jgi:hypothetical protein